MELCAFVSANAPSTTGKAPRHDHGKRCALHGLGAKRTATLRVSPRCRGIHSVVMSSVTSNLPADFSQSLSEDDRQQWQAAEKEVLQVMQSAGKSEEQEGVTYLVAQAFGWGRQSQRFWRGSVKNECPSAELVRSSLKFLKGSPLQFSDEEIVEVVLQFPQVLRLEVEGRMMQNLDYLTKNWPVFASLDRLRNAVKRQPQVLGYTVDCEGDCRSECSQCWVRF